jgi:hypothetical protein
VLDVAVATCSPPSRGSSPRRASTSRASTWPALAVVLGGGVLAAVEGELAGHLLAVLGVQGHDVGHMLTAMDALAVEAVDAIGVERELAVLDVAGARGRRGGARVSPRPGPS